MIGKKPIAVLEYSVLPFQRRKGLVDQEEGKEDKEEVSDVLKRIHLERREVVGKLLKEGEGAHSFKALLRVSIFSHGLEPKSKDLPRNFTQLCA